MTRQELLTALRPYWNQNNKQHIPLWVNALELYKKETGDHEVSLACGSCVNKIKGWLEK